MARAGLVDIDPFAATVFPLEAVAQAIAHAASNAGPFRMTLLKP
jgi:alcohol dehydrogenase